MDKVGQPNYCYDHNFEEEFVWTLLFLLEYSFKPKMVVKRILACADHVLKCIKNISVRVKFIDGCIDKL